ncbi:MAG: hypothetical protein HQK79_03340 [Desulfobacterales bacterium]|nr:hypothetical protein [Desulfobacterales bacterium]MBF0395631.1 hypothetical protein [Desulfobacterales bacterium]
MSKFKNKVLSILKKDNFVSEILSFDPKKIINPLLALLYETDESIKWKAVTSIGIVVNQMAIKDMESARNIMRRLMWNLNEESGGVGWGSPEAMGEIMAKNKNLALEYHSILISYILPERNFIENEELQKGVIWGLNRLREVYPDLIKEGNVTHLLKAKRP